MYFWESQTWPALRWIFLVNCSTLTFVMLSHVIPKHFEKIWPSPPLLHKIHWRKSHQGTSERFPELGGFECQLWAMGSSGHSTWSTEEEQSWNWWLEVSTFLWLDIHSALKMPIFPCSCTVYYNPFAVSKTFWNSSLWSSQLHLNPSQESTSPTLLALVWHSALKEQ